MPITDMFGSMGAEQEDPICGQFSLTYTQRMWGFGICFGGGFILSFFASFLLWTGGFTAFAVLYTLGNIISLVGTGFLVGFARQFKQMFDPVRLTTSIVFIATMVFTLVAALVLHSFILTLVSFIVQFLALFWYCASYIPFLRDIIKRTLGAQFTSSA
ncbi:vesicle transport protein SFT2B [Polychytrium aggregatum]|uniref:vesicle transport protein SFT2B n=1 Tax=Polychytrium aggregatum TaxID=110093 RepID=UPI0022FF2303|nr:vesicle transport protein SFT2B [Polychytrium aggregatum]KAI9209711.1 vesicle transport protein SFT2B [Polychytrium aggregatum]